MRKPIDLGRRGTYNSANQQFTLTGTGAAPTSCGGGFTPYDQIVTGSLATGSCGLANGTFQAGPGIVRSPPGTVEVSGSNALSVSERVPDGENTVATNSSADWLDQYGYPTTAQFNVNLSSGNGYNFGGRTVQETKAPLSSGSDLCSWPEAPWWNNGNGRILQLASEDSWFVQDNGQNGNYGPDLVGLSSDQIAYIQVYSPNVGSQGCTISYPQIMVINMETGTGSESYGGANSGSNTIRFIVTPTSISVQRGNATATRTFHF